GSTNFAIPASVSLAPGFGYSVQIKSQPVGQTCTVVRSTGIVTASASSVNNIGLECVDNVTDALSGTYRLSVPGSQAPLPFRPFLTFYPDGTYIFGLHQDDPDCGTGHGGIEYGVYHWNQATHEFAFLNAVIDTNTDCGVTNDAAPPPAGTLV